jgi:lipoyl(octanoyl) transferase
MTRTCELHNLHLVTYENGMAMQETLVSLRQREEIADQLLLLEHTPVITLGRGGRLSNLLADGATLARTGVRFHETTRGGDITYHGPGQIVGYPILHLGEGSRDIRRYVTNLEEVLIRTAADFGITASREEGKRGIWVGAEKLAAIGVRIARWVTSHGFAFNVEPDLDHFRLITPCGLQGTGVTSLRKLLGEAPPPELVRARLAHHFGAIFERSIIPPPPPLRIAKVVVHDGERTLLLHRSDLDFWQPVTGTVEPGESVETAASRELVEETGLSAPIEDLQLRQSFLVESTFVDESTFVAAVDGGAPVALDPEEHDASGWFTFPEAFDKIRWSDDRVSLEKAAAVARVSTHA